ncbi:tetratricopeptide repeat protein [Polluticaenibacter yanchengensis]|uniref:Tetratricopeptide repeat protein n=1 Tax=Polluticaenibacter yanchengensis TaxID=3014562 RepID=A0ABT4UFL9_9BACT|nr:tetratricopeptide repeat protein [Chitinophagaceae bacterium LY-5]
MSNEYSEEISQEEWNEIEAYLLKKMSDEESTGFEKKLAGNTDLSAKTNIIKATILGIGEAALKEKTEQFHQQIPAQKIPQKTKTNWLAAASVLAVLSISIWLLFFNQSKEDKVFAAYYQPDPGLPTYMTATHNYAFEKAMTEYKSGNYKAAIAGWESLLKQQPNNDTLAYFLGNAYMGDEDYKNAKHYYSSLIRSQKSVFTNDAWWYLGLCHIKLKDFVNAQAALKQSGKEDVPDILNELAK